jgi:dihydrofolate reductase
LHQTEHLARVHNVAEEVVMRKIVAGLFMSLDGVVESPSTWAFSRYLDAEMAQAIGSGILAADAVLLGRRTYQEFAKLWPNQPSSVPMARFLNGSPKYVVSASLRAQLEWANSTLIRGNLPQELTALKKRPGKNIQVPGSPILVRTLLRDGLLDELALSICPIVVGKGARLFDETTHDVGLKLVHSHVLASGVLAVTYTPERVDNNCVAERALSFPNAAARQ